jgi:hypothetical protein
MTYCFVYRSETALPVIQQTNGPLCAHELKEWMREHLREVQPDRKRNSMTLAELSCVINNRSRNIGRNPQRFPLELLCSRNLQYGI